MRKRTETQTEPPSDASSEDRLAPADVQNKEFGLSFRGYNEREVDEFLDRVTEDLAWYIDENRKLRSQLASSGYVDPAEWGANAEAAGADVLTRAKQEADRIVREAQARAASIGTAGASDRRAVVAPYLNREREFLRSLGGLVQEHAVTIKAMVEEARRRVEPGSSPDVSPPIVITDEDLEPPENQAVNEVESQAESQAENQAAENENRSVDERTVAGFGGDAPPHGESDDQRRSLRELFWGTD